MPFKDTKEGQTNYCEACEEQARFGHNISAIKHTCGLNKNIEGWEEAIQEEINTWVDEPSRNANLSIFIKNFIRNLLSAQRSNLVKEIEGLKVFIHESNHFSDSNVLTKYIRKDEVINLINSSK